MEIMNVLSIVIASETIINERMKVGLINEYTISEWLMPDCRSKWYSTLQPSKSSLSLTSSTDNSWYRTSLFY